MRKHTIIVSLVAVFLMGHVVAQETHSWSYSESSYLIVESGNNMSDYYYSDRESDNNKNFTGSVSGILGGFQITRDKTNLNVHSYGKVGYVEQLVDGSTNAGTTNFGEVGRLYQTGGWFLNSGGKVGDVALITGAFTNSGSVNKATISGGRFENSYTVSDVLLNSNGKFENKGGTVTNVAISGGEFENRDGKVITAVLSGGKLINTGGITNLTYNSGEFNGTYGTVDTLIIAGRLDSNTNWGKVDNLIFSENGEGYMTISGFQDGIALIDGFNGTVTNVNLNNANFVFDISAFNTNDLGTLFEQYSTQDSKTGNYSIHFDFNRLFGNANVSGTANVSFLWEDTRIESASLKFEDGAMVYSVSAADGGLDGSNTPEPATLVIFALGLAGLGLARRRK